MLINNLFKRTSVDRGVGASASDALRVLLVWWEVPSTSANIMWSESPPHCREVSFDVLGVWSSKRSRFIVHAILPKEPLPPMNKGTRPQLVRTIRQALAAQTGVVIEGITQSIIDWRGSDDKP